MIMFDVHVGGGERSEDPPRDAGLVATPETVTRASLEVCVTAVTIGCSIV